MQCWALFNLAARDVSA